MFFLQADCLTWISSLDEFCICRRRKATRTGSSIPPVPCRTKETPSHEGSFLGILNSRRRIHLSGFPASQLRHGFRPSATVQSVTDRHDTWLARRLDEDPQESSWDCTHKLDRKSPSRTTEILRNQHLVAARWSSQAIGTVIKCDLCNRVTHDRAISISSLPQRATTSLRVGVVSQMTNLLTGRR